MQPTGLKNLNNRIIWKKNSKMRFKIKNYRRTRNHNKVVDYGKITDALENEWNITYRY